MTTSTPEKVDGLKALEGAIEKISETINKLGGVFKVQMAVRMIWLDKFIFYNFYQNENSPQQPKVVTATDEADLARRMERAEAENAEIDGDEDEEEEEGMKYDGEGHGEGDEDDDAAGSDADETNADK